MTSNSYGSSTIPSNLKPQITPGVKKILFVNIFIFIFQLLFSSSTSISWLEYFFALNPELIEKGYLWQFGTYHLLHSRFSFFHIVFNMLSLWMFGSEIEKVWGEKIFIRFYAICATGSGLLIYILPKLFSNPESSFTIGASGAIFGILFVYALFWPNRMVLFMFVFPVRIKYFVLCIGLFEFVLTLRSSNAGGVSHVGHLGGIITAYLYLLYNINKRNSNLQYPLNFPMYAFEKPLVIFEILWRKIILLFSEKKVLFKPTNPSENTKVQNESDDTKKLDQILEKISQKGMKNLTKDEKLFLKKVSEEMNDKKV